MNLIDIIAEEIRNDDSDTDRQSELLKDLYANSDKNGQRAIDDTLICLCGWSLSSLLEKTG